MLYELKSKYLVAVILLATSGVSLFFVLDVAALSKVEKINELQAEISAKKNDANKLEQSISEVNAKLKKKRLESVSLSNQLSLLDNRISQVDLDVQLTQNRLDATDLEIETLQLNIEAKEEVERKQKDIVAALVRTVHQSDRKKYIEIAASYDNFSDFYNQVQYVQNVESSLGESVRTLRIVREELEEKKTNVEVKQANYASLRDELTNKQLDLEDQTFLKKDLLVQTKASEKTYNALVNSLKSQYRTIENDIASIEKDIRKRLEDQDSFKRRTGGEPSTLSWPVPSRYITARFHDPSYPYRHIFEHNAVDIRAGQGTALRAAATGYVARARKCSSSSCYAYVMLVHGGGISTVYGHVNRVLVNEDQFVNRGDIIGYSGGTPGTVGAGPFVTGPHLHFEVRLNGIPVNPLKHLIKDY